MAKITDFTSHFYLDSSMKHFSVILIMMMSLVLSNSPLDTYKPIGIGGEPFLSSSAFFMNDSTEENASAGQVETIYPGRPLLMSLVVPGLGQVYNKDSWLKIGVFAGIEIASIASYYNFSQKADQIRIDYEEFADDHWSLDDWVWNTISFENQNTSYPDVTIDGTHSLLIHLVGQYAIDHGEYITSDSLDTYPDWVDVEGVSVIRDRDFYENIGKYDQFVAGWSDFDPSDVKTIEKDVGDSIEILVTTDLKDEYLDMRYDSNNYLKMANYAITAIMFNHVISAIDAVFIANRNKSDKARKMKTDVGLLYDHRNRYGIGGVSLTVQF